MEPKMTRTRAYGHQGSILPSDTVEIPVEQATIVGDFWFSLSSLEYENAQSP